MKWVKRILATVFVTVLVAGIAVYQGDLPKEYVDSKYGSPKSQFLELKSGARIHFRDEGNAEGLAVVLVHGSNASLHTWEPWVAILGDKYRVISLDLPAHGLTGWVPDRDYSMANQISVVDAVVEHLGIERFVLGGNSMGGGITWRYALDHPDKIKAMILVDASGFPQWLSETTKANSEKNSMSKFAYRLIRKPGFRDVARHLDPYALTKQFVLSCYGDKTKVSDELIQRYYELWLREGTREGIIRRTGGSGEHLPESVNPTQFTQPTLVMWGRNDTIIPLSVAERFAAELPNNTLIVYEGVGHVPMEEIPIKSATDVLEFLDNLSSETERERAAVDAVGPP